MRGRIAHVSTFVLAAASLAAGVSSCSRSWELPGSGVDASASGGRGEGGAAAGGMTGVAGAHGTGGFGASHGGFGGLRGGFGESGGGGYGGGYGAFGGGLLPGGTGGESGCTRLTFKKHTANVIFIVGRNASMAMMLRDAPSRLEAVRGAIDAALRMPAAVAYGYQGFPNLLACSNQSPCCSGLCCSGTYLPPGPNLTISRFDSELSCMSSGSGSRDTCLATSDARPVEQALENVINNLPDSSFIDSFLVLLVDGPPGCSPSAAPSECMDELNTVGGLTWRGTKVYVVPIGDDAITDGCLTKMANVKPGMSFLLTAPDQKTLATQINSIAHTAAQSGCTLDLVDLVTPPPENTVHIKVAATDLPHDPLKMMNGWAFTTPTSTRIKVYGDACTMLLEAGSDVEVRACPR